MELRTYHLRTWRVSGMNKRSKPNIEDITVKLQGEISFEKYLKFLTVRGYDEDQPPKITDVITRAGKSFGEKEIQEAQERVNKILNPPKATAKVDYKSEFEGQKKTIDALEARLKALENKPKPGPKVGAKKKEEPKSKGDE